MWTGTQVLALDIVGGGLLGLSLPADAGGATCTSAPATSFDRPPAADPTASAAAGWTTTPLPFGPRTGMATAWTGHEYVAWGGTDGTTVFGDGVVVDPATGEVRTMSPAPIDARVDAVAVWTGTEVLVVGGSTGAGTSSALTTQPAAAYDPATDRWRLLPRSKVQLDLPGTAVDASSVWTRDGLYVLTADGGALLPPGAANWLTMPRLPTDATLLDAVADESGLLAATTDADGHVSVHRYDPPSRRPSGDGVMDSAGGAWRAVGTSPQPLSARAAGWTGTELVLAAGGESDPTGSAWAAATFDPTTGIWQELAGSPTHPGAELIWTGADTMLVIKGGYGLLDRTTGALADATSPTTLRFGTGRGTGDGAVFLADAVVSGGCAAGFVVARYRP